MACPCIELLLQGLLEALCEALLEALDNLLASWPALGTWSCPLS